ncbi:MAG: EamA family transporter RarD [Mogibacterium sp.]|nr:EamA family transporter RarD [Mogibacterium sp.]
MKDMSTRDSEYRQGVIYVLFCQIMWGFLPIYWQSLVPIESWMIILYRIFTIFICAYVFARFKYSRAEILAPLKDRKTVLISLAAGLLLTLNWNIYIWAMTTAHFVQSAIGYYIEPLVICAFGIILFHEKLTKYNLTAMAFAVMAIVIILIHYAQLPTVALGLAFTWAVYSAIKKASNLPPVIALVYETAPFAFISLFAILFIEIKGIGALSVGAPREYALMWMSGLMTFIPISLFGYAAKKTTLLVIGLSQYISPSITLMLGIFLYREPIDMVQIIAFGIIWIGLVIFTIGEFKRHYE